MTEEERKRVKGLISERRKFLKEISRIENDEIDALQKMLEDDTSIIGNPQAHGLFPYNYAKLTKAARSEIAMKCHFDFNNALFTNDGKTASEHEKTAEEILAENGCDDDIIILKDESYDTALIGVTDDNRAVYSYDKMVEWYMAKNNCSDEEAVEWIEYNTIRALPYMGSKAPVVVHEFC